MSKVAIVGVEGSGKTVLMAALADQYGKPSKDSLYLMPENQAAFSFMTHIPHKMREEHQWPAATAMESMKHLKWTIRIGQKVLMDLEMLDYPGELYRMAFGERKKDEIEPYLDQVHEFLEHLVTADYLVVLLNLKDALNIGGNARNNETVWLTRGIFDYSQKLPNIQKRLLLFTQADRYPDELAGPGGLMAAKEKYMPMLHVLYPGLECAAVSVATDESDAPARTFSGSHGVTGLMRWLALQTDVGTRVKAQLEDYSECIENASNGHVAPQEIKDLLEKLDTINPGLCEILEPNGLERRRIQLRTLYRQSVLAACDACREQAKRAASLDALKQILGEYHQHLESLSQHSDPPVDDKETVAIQAHREDYEHFLGLYNQLEKFINTHSSWQLAQAQSWLPLSNKYTDSTSKNLIARTRSQYAAAILRRIAIATGAVCLLVVIAYAIYGSNKAEQKRAETASLAEQARAETEAKARQVQIEAAAKAERERVEAAAKAERERVEAAAKAAKAERERVETAAKVEMEAARLASAAAQGDSASRAALAQQAEQGIPPAQWYLGVLFSNEGNASAARNWWIKAARQKYLNAQLQMAKIEDKDNDKIRWYQEAAQNGNAEAQLNLGALYIKRYKKLRDEYTQWKKTPKMSHLYKQDYDTEKWMKSDMQSAKKASSHYYSLAAEQGIAEAQYIMGQTEELGDDNLPIYSNESNERAAVEWYRKAARQGHTEAQKSLTRLGYMW